MAWYEHDEFKNEIATQRCRPVEFDLEVEPAPKPKPPSRFELWVARMNEIHDIVASNISPNQTYGPHDIEREPLA